MSEKKRNRISAVEISGSSTPEITLQGNVKTIVIKNSGVSPDFLNIGFNEIASTKVQLAAGDGIALSVDDGTILDGNRIYSAFANMNSNNSGFMITISELDEDPDC